MCELLNFQTFWKCFSCLSLADFWLDSTIAEEYALYDFSHLKFVETCFMPQKIVSSSDYVMWIEKNVYSPVLLIMLLKHIFLLKKNRFKKRLKARVIVNIKHLISTQQGTAKGAVGLGGGAQWQGCWVGGTPCGCIWGPLPSKLG